DVLPGIFQNVANPLEIAEAYRDRSNRLLSLFNAYGQVRIVDGLVFKTSVGAGIGYTNSKMFYTAPAGAPIYGYPSTTTLNVNNDQTINWLVENTLNYKKVFSDVHSFDVLAGYTGQKVANES